MWLIYPEIRDFQILITKTVFHEASLATKFAQVICDQIQFSNFSTEQKKTAYLMVSSLQNYTIFATVGLGFLTASMLQVHACWLFPHQ